MNVFLLNAGSSSLKFQLINAGSGNVLTKGIVDEIGLESCRFIVNEQARERRVCDHDEAVQLVLSVIELETIHAVGHRVVHGGEKYRTATLIDEDVINTIRELSMLAPLYGQPEDEHVVPRASQNETRDLPTRCWVSLGGYLYRSEAQWWRSNRF